jgi:hypothetical protein
VRFTVLAAPGSDAGEARTRASAVVDVAGADAVAAAARAAADPYLLVLRPGARLQTGSLGGVRAVLERGVGVLGGAAYTGGWRHYGWMLAPATASPLPFEALAIQVPASESGSDAQVRGPIDVPAPGMVLAERTLLLERLPDEPLAAWLELAARARAAGREVLCLPSFACSMPPEGGDDRGRLTALRLLAQARPELVGHARLPAGAARRIVEREVRFEGGLRRRLRIPLPPVTVLLHGEGAERSVRRARELPAVVAAHAVGDPAEALRTELRVRGDRSVLVVDTESLPDPDALADLAQRLEDAPYVAAVAPSAAALEGSCVLLAAGRFPLHLQPVGPTLVDALRGFLGGAETLGRAVRATGHVMPERLPPPRRLVRLAFVASSAPEILRTCLDAAHASTRPGDEFVAIVPTAAETARRILEANALARIELDDADPLLSDATNRALADGPGLTFLLGDDVLVTSETLDRLRAAFDRIPGLGAALPAVPAAAGGEGIHDVTYADLQQMRGQAVARGREHARDCTPIDVAVTPAIVLAREALDAVGGLDPALGPTRRGIADLVLRIRAAGYAVVRCDDTLVHRFDADASRSAIAVADALQPFVSAPDRAVIARGFDPSERIPFVRNAPSTAAAPTAAVVLPVGDAAELERAIAFVATAAAALTAADPLRLDVVIDGEVPTAVAAARIRAVLAERATPLAQSVAVRIERVDDLAAWRGQCDPALRWYVAAGHARTALDADEAVTAAALATLVRATR